MVETYERKLVKFQELVPSCNEKAWAVRCFPIAIGCRGFVGKSASNAMSALGLYGTEKQSLREAGDKAERASLWIWIRRDVPNWSS